mgnify:FL=1
MSHKSKKSLVRQVQERLVNKMSAGNSKHLDKRQDGVTSEKIYSFNTIRDYQKHACNFVKWAKQEYNCKTLDECHSHINEYLSQRADKCSAWTVKLDAAALGKLYSEPTTTYSPTPSRHRNEVVRSRKPAVRDRHFSESKNSKLVDFCKSTGLRRSEVAAARGTDLVPCRESPCGLGIHVRSGKGGRERIAPIYTDQNTLNTIKDICSQSASGKIFAKVPSCADIHSYRSDYCEKVYFANARDVSTLSQKELYICRGDRAQIKLDRAALATASRALGHNRISVIPSSYLYHLDKFST